MKALVEFVKSNLRDTLLKGLEDTISSLKKVLAKNSEKYNSLLLLEGQLNDLNKQKMRGTISDENLHLSKNRIRASLMDLINSIDSRDLEESSDDNSSKPAKVQKAAQAIEWRAELIENESLDKFEFAIFANEKKRSLKLVLLESRTTQLHLDEKIVFSSSLNVLNGIVGIINFFTINRDTIDFEIEEEGIKYPASVSFGASAVKDKYIKLKLTIDGNLIYAGA